MNESTIATIATVSVAVLLSPVLVIVGTVIGAASGWLVGLFFPDALSIFGMQPYQLGVLLGFASGFFRTSTKGSQD